MKKLLIVITLVAIGLTGIASIALADTAKVDVKAVVTGTCKFQGGGSITYAIDQAGTGDVTPTIVQPTFWCTKNTSYTIGDDNGLNETGTTFRMKHDTLAGEFIPYTFEYTKTGSGAGKTTPITMNITSKVAAADYADVASGNYGDTVLLTVSP